MEKLPFAEDLGHFWKTSKTSADNWIDKTIGLIRAHGGKPLQSMTGQDMQSGKSTFLLAFQFNGEVYKISWPVLPSREKDEKAAKTQAATLLYHTVKAKFLEAEILGMRTAFLPFLALPDGRTAAQMETPEILSLFSLSTPQLTAGEDVDGEYREVE